MTHTKKTYLFRAGKRDLLEELVVLQDLTCTRQD